MANKINIDFWEKLDREVDEIRRKNGDGFQNWLEGKDFPLFMYPPSQRKSIRSMRDFLIQEEYDSAR